MFEFFKRWTSSRQARRSDVVLWVNLPEIPAPAGPRVSAPNLSSASVSATSFPAASFPASGAHIGQARSRGLLESPQASHRERLLAMRLEHLALCPAERCRELAGIGVQTAGDLVYGEPKKIAAAFRNPQRAERAIRRYRAAIRLAAAVDSMMPRDALLLVAIHRRSVASLSRESAAQLHRDLERFSLSSRGSKLIGRRGVPSLRRVRSWVATCRQIAGAVPTIASPAMS